MEKTSGREELTASTTSARVIVSEPPGPPTPGKAAPVAVPLRLAPTYVLPRDPDSSPSGDFPERWGSGTTLSRGGMGGPRLSFFCEKPQESPPDRTPQSG